MKTGCAYRSRAAPARRAQAPHAANKRRRRAGRAPRSRTPRGAVPQQDVLLVEPAPAVKVPLLAVRPPNPAHHAVAVPTPRNVGQGGRTPEGIGGEYSRPGGRQPLRVRGASNRFRTRPSHDGRCSSSEHVPRPHCSRPVFPSRRDVSLHGREGPQVVLDQHVGPSSRKCGLPGFACQPLDAIVRDRHQRAWRAARGRCHSRSRGMRID